VKLLDYKNKRDRNNLSDNQLHRCFQFIDTFINYLQCISYDYMKSCSKSSNTISNGSSKTMIIDHNIKIMIPGK